jgi:hypothetical protein
MSVFRIPAGKYLTNVSSTPVIGPVTRDLLSPLVVIGRGAILIGYKLIKISLGTKWLQRSMLGE